MIAQVPAYQIQLLHHTLGLSERRRESYRNHFVAGHGNSDMLHLEALVRAGLMERRRTPTFCDPADIVFAATDAGLTMAIAALPEPTPPAKRTRYEEYLDADGCGGDSFGEFLCGSRLPEFERRGDWRKEEYRMFRRAYSHTYDRYGYRDVQGEWQSTKKDAKASYKAALKACAMRLRQPRPALEHA